MHLPPLIHDLGLILLVAGFTSLLFKRLKQPVVLGYILAGFLVSQNFPFLPDVSDFEDIKIWAEIGVIFLLFNLGLEFSFKKLMHTGSAAGVTAITEVSAMVVIGFGLGKLLGWSFMDCIFLGGILSISSTTIILRAFDELGMKGRRFANLVFGVLIVEDLVAVLLLVLLSTIAVSRQFEGTQMLISVSKLVFYLLLWFVSGIFFLPTLLNRLKKMLNDESMLIVSIGLCLAMVMLASAAGFSPALGAFIMGSILAETTKAEHIEHLIKPVKDLFGAVFFVSVGMLINPTVLKDYAFPILAITCTLLFFKTLNVAIGALLSGQSLKTALQAGMSQAQIGEFSFIIATLGLTLKVTSDFLYPVAVAVSAVTSFTTPYMIRGSEPFYRWLNAKLPAGIRRSLNRYSTGAQSLSGTNDWHVVLRSYFSHVLILSIIILGIIVLSSRYIKPLFNDWVTDGLMGSIIAALICFLAILPLLWSLVARKSSQQAFTNLWSERRYRAPLLFLRLFRVAIGILYVGIFLLSFFSVTVAAVCLMIIAALVAMFYKRIHLFYIRIENRFLANFNDREIQQRAKRRHELAPWDAIISRFEIPLGSPVSGITLQSLALRERFGVNIAMIKRGEDYTIMAPERNEKMYPGDAVFAIGTDEQLVQFKKEIDAVDQEYEPTQDDDIVLKKITVAEGSEFVNKSIRESDLRVRTNGIIVGIERGNRRILNPESNFIFEAGDLIWVVGHKALIGELMIE
ncbi:MAG TPA: cation:proton antiporter [Flavipsychrobacter sp.]|nr:cation:proton antiporter [Flavipsychrobacter sp.]